MNERQRKAEVQRLRTHAKRLGFVLKVERGRFYFSNSITKRTESPYDGMTYDEAMRWLVTG